MNAEAATRARKVDLNTPKELTVDQETQNNTTDLLGLGAGPVDVLKEVLANVEGVDAGASDDDLDAWWGIVDSDRVASGLTLIDIGKLAAQSHGNDFGGPWIQKSDANGDEPTQLTAAGRAAVRQVFRSEGQSR